MSTENETSPAESRTRLKLLSAFVAGVCVYPLGEAVLDAVLRLSLPGASLAWRDYARMLVPIALGLVILVVSFRIIWRSIMPGAMWLISIVILIWSLALLGS